MLFSVVVVCALMCCAATAPSRRDNNPFGVRRTKAFNTELNATAIDVLLDVPPRYMWGWGIGVNGYCGETSFQSHGIFWGNWVSSERVREASGGSELLIAVDDTVAAKALKFPFEEWDYEAKSPQSGEFIAWLRGHIDNGHMAAIGVYEKQKTGDNDYDHIVPVVGYQYDPSSLATLAIYYNDLYENTHRSLSVTSDVQSRKGCRQSAAPVQPYTYCLPQSINYGVALFGIQDSSKETHRMVLTMPSWTEPDYGDEDGIHAKPIMFTVSATVYGLTPFASYAVLRFDSYQTLPTDNFARSSAVTKRFNFTATGSTHSLTQFDAFMSDSTVFYRTVKL